MGFWDEIPAKAAAAAMGEVDDEDIGAACIRQRATASRLLNPVRVGVSPAE